MSENDPQWIYRKLRELEERVRALEGPKKIKVCPVCGHDMNRPWVCFAYECPKNTVEAIVNAP